MFAAQLRDVQRLAKARVHPIGVRAALMTYKSGRGVRGSGGQEGSMSVELTIVVLWMVFPIGLACGAGGGIGRALAQLRPQPGTPVDPR